MPGYYAPEDAGSMLADLRHRVQMIENGLVTRALTQIATATPLPVGGLPFVSVPAFAVAHFCDFTLDAPTSDVLGFVSDTFYGTGGTANYVIERCVILDGSHTTVQAYGGTAYQTNGMGVANCGLHITATLPPGNYSLAIMYSMQGGAATTFSDLQGQLDVYLMSS